MGPCEVTLGHVLDVEGLLLSQTLLVGDSADGKEEEACRSSEVPVMESKTVADNKLAFFHQAIQSEHTSRADCTKMGASAYRLRKTRHHGEEADQHFENHSESLRNLNAEELGLDLNKGILEPQTLRSIGTWQGSLARAMERTLSYDTTCFGPQCKHLQDAPR